MVVLLHGLGRSKRAMQTLQKYLEKNSYTVVNIAYPSTKHPIEVLSQKVSLEIEKQRLQYTPKKIHFVTHSMGGIILRYIMKHTPIKGIGNTVMLGPPNRGSEVVDNLRNLSIFRIIQGPAGQQLGTDEQSIPNQLGAVDFSVGVIAGNRSVNPLLSLLIPGDNDGKVSVERSKVLGMKDFLIMKTTHTFMMHNPKVIQQVLYFLEHGQFQHG